MMRRILLLVLTFPLILAACGGEGDDSVSQVPTATLVPLVTLSPQPTATPVVTRTPLPTNTPLPSDTPPPSNTPITPTLTPTPTISGIVGGAQRINFRDGPGREYNVIGALTPGDGLIILGQNSEGTWLNVRDREGTEGWVSAGLIFIPPTATPFPSLTPTVDLTALALGTPLPTSVIGGGTVTVTPPPVVLSGTPDADADDEEADDESASIAQAEPTEPFLPVVNVDAINQTATALAGGIAEISPPPPQEPLTPAATGQSPNVIPTATPGDPSAAPRPTTTPPPASDNVSVQENRLVFALCDNPDLGGPPPPTDLAVGSSIIVWWSWIVADPSFMPQHEANVTYEVTVNEETLANWRSYGGTVEPSGNSYVKSWYVPAGELTEPGTYRIAYRASWSQQISDGYELFGPGTNNLIEEGSCTFTVGE